MAEYRIFTIKHIHALAKEHYVDWFPDLPSYERFNCRLNRISYSFGLLFDELSKLWRKQLDNQSEMNTGY